MTEHPTDAMEAFRWQVARAISIPQHHTTWDLLSEREKDLFYMQAGYAIDTMEAAKPSTPAPTGALVTTAMIEAGMDAFNANLDGLLSSDLLLEDCVRNIYLAMNAARTTPIADGEAMPDITDEGWRRTLDRARTPIADEGLVEKLRSALARLDRNFDLMLAGKPVRDVAETKAEVRNALEASNVS